MKEFWLINPAISTDKLQLPIPPADYNITQAVNSATIVVLGLGEVNCSGNPKLAVIPPIVSVFPNQAYDWCQYSNFPTPDECIDMIQNWLTKGTIIQYMITGTKVNIQCTIDSLQIGEADATGDVSFTLQLTEYKAITNIAKEGWISSGGLWYYYNANGTKATGWLLWKDKYYYLNPNGSYTDFLAGTEGKSLRIEAIRMKLMNAPANVHLQYQAQIQHIGWQKAVLDGADCGTTGKALRLEAIQIKIIGATNCYVQYRSYVQNIGWMAVVRDGAISGTVGKSLRMEAIQISAMGTADYHIQYQVYIQNTGWQGWVSDGYESDV